MQQCCLEDQFHPLSARLGHQKLLVTFNPTCIAVFNWGLFLNPVSSFSPYILGLAQGGTVIERQESGKWRFFSGLLGKAFKYSWNCGLCKDCWALGISPKQIFSPSPEQDSSILEMRVEGMLYPSVLENVLQRKVVWFLAGDELKQNFDSGNCYHQVSRLEVISTFEWFVYLSCLQKMDPMSEGF